MGVEEFLKEFGINIGVLTIIYVPIISAITAWIVKGFDLIKDKHAQVVSLGLAITISVIDGCVIHMGIPQMIIRGLILALLANGGYDALRSIGAHRNKGG